MASMNGLTQLFGNAAMQHWCMQLTVGVAFEIVLPTGPTVRVLSGFDPRTLGQVLAVLEGRSC